MSDVLSVGELMWDLHLELGELLEVGERLRRVPGGATANTAVALSQLGVSVSIGGRVSDDALGEGFCQLLHRRFGIDTSAVLRVRGRMGLVFIERCEAVHERFVSYRPELASATVTPPASWSGRVLHISTMNPDAAELEALAAVARATAGWVVADANARPRAYRMASVPKESFVDLLAHVDVLKVSDGDLQVLSPHGIDMAWLRRALSPTAVVLHTRAEAATRVCCGDDFAFDIDVPQLQLVRSIGAGDAFCAGLLSHLATCDAADVHAVAAGEREAFWRDAVELGHEVAARRVTTSW